MIIDLASIVHPACDRFDEATPPKIKNANYIERAHGNSELSLRGF